MLKGNDTKSLASQLSRQLKVHAQMSEEQTEDIKILTFSSEQQDWDDWSQKF